MVFCIRNLRKNGSSQCIKFKPNAKQNILERSSIKIQLDNLALMTNVSFNTISISNCKSAKKKGLGYDS